LKTCASLKKKPAIELITAQSTTVLSVAQ